MSAISTDPSEIEVVAGVLTDRHGRVLIAQRLPGTHMAGRWEFPGGKRDSEEGGREALGRELAEELGIRVTSARPLIAFRHRYPERNVRLEVWHVDAYDGEPRGLDNQALQWVSPEQLTTQDLLEADRPIVTALLLPPHYLISDPNCVGAEIPRRLSAALRRGARLCQLRRPGANITQLEAVAVPSLACCRRFGARLLLNGDPRASIELCEKLGADGVHLPAWFLNEIDDRPLPDTVLVGASCHDGRELERAEQVRVDFAVLGPVLPTASHPDAETMGWDRFQSLVADANLPIYALGGMQIQDTARAIAVGGQGIAAVRALF